ncbi:hypothetical protein MNBD_CHLOROFLEXI01-2892 [hydrothermal vent metagenome]|uniref:Uncharacterized protein n=1 Tax=hydrothermal vent metagenome TaxID=652676 RepID=A0A3B0VXH7_9ZZZZ
MPKLISDLGSYLQAVFLDGSQKVFTGFDILGIFLFFFPDLIKLNGSLATTIGGGIILLSFVLANFSLYRKSVKETKFSFKIIKVEHTSLRGNLLNFSNNEVHIEPTFFIFFQAVLHLSNSGPVTSVQFYIDTVEPNCQDGEISPGEIEVTLQTQPIKHHQPVEHENPYYLQSDEMKKILFNVEIPFATACVEEYFGSLSSFKEMKLRIAAKPTGQKPIFEEAICDLTSIHEGIDEQIATKIGHLQNTNLSSKQVLETIKRYYGAG